MWHELYAATQPPVDGHSQNSMQRVCVCGVGDGRPCHPSIVTGLVHSLDGFFCSPQHRSTAAWLCG